MIQSMIKFISESKSLYLTKIIKRKAFLSEHKILLKFRLEKGDSYFVNFTTSQFLITVSSHL